MILAADIGNTNIKFGVFDEGALKYSFRLSAALNKTSDEYGFNLKSMLSQSGFTTDEFEGAVVCSVNPNLNYTIEHMIDYYFKVKPIIVGAGIKTGLNIKYDNPKEVGADRIMGCLGAYYGYGGPCVVVDYGTATTFNAVSERGEFLGGAISIGIKSAADALSRSAAKLPRVELVRPAKAINKNTITNMQAGIVGGFIGLTEYIVRQIKAEMEGDPRVIATGGLSEIIAPHTGVIDIVDRTLTLKGLYRACLLNR
ncbi:MAG: type III pantothenate kinase [Firmicutes bacterium]|nr:type III pantothenate kinase [Bacillota bacterium]